MAGIVRPDFADSLIHPQLSLLSGTAFGVQTTSKSAAHRSLLRSRKARLFPFHSSRPSISIEAVMFDLPVSKIGENFSFMPLPQPIFT